MDEYEGRIDKMREEAENKSKEVRRLENELAESEDKARGVKDDLETKTEMLDEYERRIDDFVNTLRYAERTRNIAVRNVVSSSGVLAALRRENARLKADVARLEGGLADAKEIHEASVRADQWQARAEAVIDEARSTGVELSDNGGDGENETGDTVTNLTQQRHAAATIIQGYTRRMAACALAHSLRETRRTVAAGGGGDFNLDEDRAAEDDLETPFDVKDELGARLEELSDSGGDGENETGGIVAKLRRELEESRAELLEATTEAAKVRAVSRARSAHVRLGFLYDEGVDVEKDDVKVIQHWKVAAMSGDELCARIVGGGI